MASEHVSESDNGHGSADLEPAAGFGSEEGYARLKSIAQAEMSRQPPGQTLTATALVLEAFIKLSRRPSPQDRNHATALACSAMRSILVDRARRKMSLKSLPRHREVPLDSIFDQSSTADNALYLDEALKRLETIDSELAKIMELHIFGGLTQFEIATLQSKSVRTIQRQLAVGRAWLLEELE